jgi:enoyl-CoA hydratase/carnithine racemase
MDEATKADKPFVVWYAPFLPHTPHNPPERLLEAAREIAREIVDHTAPVSVALIRQMVWRLLGADHPMEAHKLESRGVYALGQLADSREGVVSFLEKRAPEFSLKPSVDMPGFYPWWEEPDFSE